MKSYCNRTSWFSREAFTLIELLVVIAIISVLAALLLPALARAKQQGWSARCESNLRQMEIALRLYLNDNAETYPNSIIVWPNINVTYWVDSIAPYYPVNWMNRAYHYPGYNGWITNSLPSSVIEGRIYVGSYGYNAYGSGGVGRGLGLGPTTPYLDSYDSPTLRDSVIRAPSEMIALGDTEYWYFGDTDGLPPGLQVGGFVPWGAYDLEMSSITFTAAQASRAYLPRHGDNYNFACCDGHVEAMPPSLLFSPKASAQRWNWDHLPHPETWTP